MLRELGHAWRAITRNRGSAAVAVLSLALGIGANTTVFGLRLAVLAVGLGLGPAFLLARVLRHLLFGVRTDDPVVFVAVSLFLAAVAVMASWAPARRAARVDPIVALREE